MLRTEEGVRPYVLIPKDKLGENDFARMLYIETEEPEKIFIPTDQPLEERIIREVVSEVEATKLEIETFEKTVDAFLGIFQKHFKNLYPHYCGFAAVLTAKIFTEILGYGVKIKKSKRISHYFVEIIDKTTGRTWVFDPTAKQFEKSFGEQYLSSRYEKKQKSLQSPLS